MRLSRVRFTIRRMMIALAVATIFTVLVGNFFRYSRARWDYERFRTYYDSEGTVSAGSCAEKSRRLLDAHLALCLTRWGQTEAIKAHVERLSRLADEERREHELWCHRSGIAELFEIEQMLSEGKEMLKRANGEP